MEFYTIKSKNTGEEQWQFNLSLNPQHPVYEGHFPQQAVAPGAMLTEMVKHIVENELGKTLRMTRARNIKFLNMLLPEKADNVDLEMSVAQEDEISVQAQAKIGEDIYFKISASYEVV